MGGTVVVWKAVGATIILVVAVRVVLDVITTLPAIVIGFVVVTVAVGVVAMQEQAFQSMDNLKLLKVNINSIGGTRWNLLSVLFEFSSTFAFAFKIGMESS